MFFLLCYLISIPAMLSHCNTGTLLTVFAHNEMERFLSFPKPCLQFRTSSMPVLLQTITSWLVPLPLISCDLNPSFCLINLLLVPFYSCHYLSQKASKTLTYFKRYCKFLGQLFAAFFCSCTKKKIC